jgi:hypothetical protein
VRDEELDCCVAGQGFRVGLLQPASCGGDGTAIMIAFGVGELLERSWE